MDHQTHRKAQEPVDLAHPLAVALGQVVVDGDNVNALAGQCVEVNRHGGHQRLAFAGLHLGNAGAVQHNAADDLHGIGFEPQNTPVRLAADGEGLGQNVVQRGAVFELFFEIGGLGLKLLIGELLHLRLQLQHLVGNGLDPL